MKSPLIKPLLLTISLLLVHHLPLCGANANEERVSETFTYDSGPQAPFYGEGTGWDQKSRGWAISSFKEDGASRPLKEGDVIGNGSLEYQDADGKKFPSQGNQLLNTSETRIRALRRFDVNLPIFDKLRIDAIDGKEPRDERGQDGLGKAKGTLWFSMLIQPKDTSMAVTLTQDVYNMEQSGVSFKYSEKTGDLSCGQPWSDSKGVSPKIPLSNPEKPTWVVAKITFGDNWGEDDPSNPLYAAIKRDDRPEPTGKLLVWLNPKLGEEPNEANADVNVPLHEFRVNRFDSSISKGAALDEIRLGTSFQQVNH
jgi:hypothetical protein